MEKFSKYTTFDIKRLFGLKIELLKDWMRRGYISPSIQKASGQGTKNIFSLQDIYFIMLFKHLVDRGLRRKKAKDAVTSIRNFYNQYPGEVDYVVYVKRAEKRLKNTKKGNKSASALIKNLPPLECYILSEEMFRTKSLSDILTSKGKAWYKEEAADFDDLIIVKFSKLKEKVDTTVA